MTYRTPAQRRRDQALAEARARLVAHLQEVVGPAMTAAAAQAVLEQAKAWASPRARELDDHIAENPDALTAPSPHCPASLVRLLRLLEATGHGDAVTQLGCVVCGTTRARLSRLTPEGRCCCWCADRDRLQRCSRCHEDGQIYAHREEGPICRRCYRKDPLFLKDCASCGRRRRPAARREDGTVLCPSCLPRPERQCVRCGNLGPAVTNGEEGPVCRRCYESPPRRCGLCGEIRPITVRAADGRPDICVGCYRGRLDECSVCGRRRHGYRVSEQRGAFHCVTCRPRPSRRCADCGNTRAVAAEWPMGVVCSGCYKRRRRNPSACSDCGNVRILIGRPQEGQEVCGPCCGTDSPAFTCRRCGLLGDLHSNGVCLPCTVGDRVRDLLGNEDGVIAPQFQPVADGLMAADRPLSVLRWIRDSHGARILAGLATQRSEITHEALDSLPQNPATRYVRELLVATGILPRRQEYLSRLELWLNDVLEGLPSHQARIIRPFAEWSVLRDARRRAARGRYATGAARGDRDDVRAAIEFMTWLDTNQLTLAAVAQEDVDLWLTTHPTRHRAIKSFIRWTVARRLTGTLTIPARRSGLPSHFLSDAEYDEQLRRCLNDDTLPLEVRIVGALIRLYALPASRIVELTTDRFEQEKDGAYFTFDRNPVLLPPKLARLIEAQIARPRRSMLAPLDGNVSFLLPGQPASKPRSESSVIALMKQYDLPILSARNTAMIEVVAELPPIVVSDLFGVSVSSAHAWAQYAQDSWADYLAACQGGE